MSAFDNISFKKIANLTLRVDSEFMILCKRKSQDYYLSVDDIDYICEILPMVAKKIADKMAIKTPQLRNPINKIKTELLWEAIDELKENKNSYYGYDY